MDKPIHHMYRSCSGQGVKYKEEVAVFPKSDKPVRGQVLKVVGDRVIAQVFDDFDYSRMNRKPERVEFTGEPIKQPLSRDMLGRVFSGTGRPLDGQPEIIPETYRAILGDPINPCKRVSPSEMIETGISSIDIMCPIFRGQKIAILSGLPTGNNFAEDDGFVFVLGLLGVSASTARNFLKGLQEVGKKDATVVFVNSTTDPCEERLVTPHIAMTTAEYLAFDCDKHVIVVLLDIYAYVDVRVPRSRQGKLYTDELGSDLATIYERAGVVESKKGSITLLPVVTMPNDDITHVITDTTIGLTEGHIVLDRHLFGLNVCPPVDVKYSMSRVMSRNLRFNPTCESHLPLAQQLGVLYHAAKEVCAKRAVLGSDELESEDLALLTFYDKFRSNFLSQGENVNYSVSESLDRAWETLHGFPRSQLSMIPAPLRTNRAAVEEFYSAQDRAT